MKTTQRNLLLDRAFISFATAAREFVGAPDPTLFMPVPKRSRLRMTKRKGAPGYRAHTVNPAGSKAHRLGRNV